MRIFHKPIFMFRSIVGFWLLDLMLWWLPKDESMRTGLIRGVSEQFQYDRYEGWALINHATPLPFDIWRTQRATLQNRPRNRVKRVPVGRIAKWIDDNPPEGRVQDASWPWVVRETA